MKVCVVCEEEVEKVNRRGMCLNCAYNQIVESIKQLREKRGPYYEMWKMGVAHAREKKRAKQGMRK